jgi:hypothetical protein
VVEDTLLPYVVSDLENKKGIGRRKKTSVLNINSF